MLSDDVGKSGAVEFLDAFLTFSFSGLAQCGRDFDLTEWLPEALCDSGATEAEDPMSPKEGCGVLKALSGLTDALTARFRSLHCSMKAKRTSIVFSGYRLGSDGQDHGILALISNFETMTEPGGNTAHEKFSLYLEEVSLGSIVFRQVGGGRIFIEEAEVAAELLALPIHPRNAMRSLVQSVQAAADREPTGSVGKRCSGIYLLRNDRRAALTDYYSDSVAETMYYPTYVNAKYDKEGAFIIYLAEASGFTEDGTPIASRVPVVGRNRPCPCGRGRKYKHCHGKTPSQGDFGPEGAHSVRTSVRTMIKQAPSHEINLMEVLSRSGRPVRRHKMREP